MSSGEVIDPIIVSTKCDIFNSCVYVHQGACAMSAEQDQTIQADRMTWPVLSPSVHPQLLCWCSGFMKGASIYIITDSAAWTLTHHCQ